MHIKRLNVSQPVRVRRSEHRKFENARRSEKVQEQKVVSFLCLSLSHLEEESSKSG